MLNPFEFGRELGSSELVDRQEELRAVVRAMSEAGRLFLIGPRRFGKTSILRVAAERSRDQGVVVLRYDAEAFPTLARLGQAILEGAAGTLGGSARKTGQKIQSFFSALRPQITFNPLDQSFSITLATAGPGGGGSDFLLAEILDGLDRMAGDAGRPVAVVIDEFQRVVELGGLDGEARLRAAVQRHDHLAYVFAGSKTGMLAQMTGDPGRPFYRLGERLFVGSIPRDDFIPFIRTGFDSAGFRVREDAVTAILDLATDVPYNVQRLAHACWNHARDRSGKTAWVLDGETVRQVLEELVRRDDPFYTQTWNRLAASQQRALRAVIDENGTGLYARDVLGRHGLALSTMRTALQGLAEAGVTRMDESMGSLRHLLEDPFFASWIRLFVVAP